MRFQPEPSVPPPTPSELSVQSQEEQGQFWENYSLNRAIKNVHVFCLFLCPAVQLISFRILKNNLV